MENDKKRILFVGLTCVDIVYQLNGFPEEEGDHAAEAMRWCAGGNASNTAQVFAKLMNWKKRRSDQDPWKEFQVEFVGSLGGGLPATWLEEFLRSKGIIIHVQRYPDMICPTTTVINNSVGLTRTFVYYTEHVPEPSHEDMKKCDLLSAHWIHFEGRMHNLPAIKETIRYIRRNDPAHRVKISFELEQESADLNAFFEEEIDVFFVGRQFSPVNGWKSLDEALAESAKRIKRSADLICIWGTDGSKVVKVNNGEIMAGSLAIAPCYPPKKKVVDTCAAGDAYLASVIFDMVVNGNSVGDAINFGSKVAGVKVGLHGYEQLDDWDSFF